MGTVHQKRLKETLNSDKNRIKEYEQLLARSLEDCKNSGVKWVPVAVPPGLPCPKYKGWYADEVKCTGIGPLPPAPTGTSAGGPKTPGSSVGGAGISATTTDSGAGGPKPPAAGGSSTAKTPSASCGECTLKNPLGPGCAQ